MFDSWLTVNSDFYYIKWNSIQQVFTLPCGYQFYDNAGDARSFGPELEVDCEAGPRLDGVLQRRLDRREDQPPEYQLYDLFDDVASPSRTVRPIPCQTGSSCSAPVMNVVKDTASFALNYATTVMTDWRLTGARRVFVRGLLI